MLGQRNPAKTAGKLLAKKGLTLAVAESCTGGLLASLFTDTAGSSAYFKGGLVAYQTPTKTKILGIKASMLRQNDVVSLPIARAMAASAKRLFGADYGIGVTGNAGPSRGDSQEPVGTVCIAIVGPESTRRIKKRFTGSRLAIKSKAAREASNLLRLELL